MPSSLMNNFTTINKTQFSSIQTGHKIVYIYDHPASKEILSKLPQHQYWEWACINGLVEGYDKKGRKQIFTK